MVARARLIIVSSTIVAASLVTTAYAVSTSSIAHDSTSGVSGMASQVLSDHVQATDILSDSSVPRTDDHSTRLPQTTSSDRAYRVGSANTNS
jgi:hypothetical protein